MADYQIWISGAYRYGVIGYGIVIQPGHIQITGTCRGSSILEAERIAVRTAFAQIPAQTSCVVYSNFPPMIAWLRGLMGADVPVQSLQAEIADLRDTYQREAQHLSDLGCMTSAPSKL